MKKHRGRRGSILEHELNRSVIFCVKEKRDIERYEFGWHHGNQRPIEGVFLLKGETIMLDVKLLREDLEGVIRKVSRRNGDFSYLREFPALDSKRRELIQEGDRLKAYRNEESKKIGMMKAKKQPVEHLFKEIADVGEKIAKIDQQIAEIDEQIFAMLAKTPNIPADDIPDGKDDTENREVRKWGEPRKFDFEAKPHWDLGTDLGLFDFERAAKISGQRFTVYKGLLAKLERSVEMFMLDTHTLESGYTEVLPPYMVTAKSMFSTGQLPKFKEDAYKCENVDAYLIPTAEVPVTNLHRDEILDVAQLPIKYAAYSSCFRAEAGSAGRDTRGIIRQHQFQKVELVKFVTPETGWEELESLTRDAEKILQKLNLPYRVVCLSSGDIGFSSAKTYDLEVWLPSYGQYKEISSCSCFTDYQARRGNIRFRRSKDAKPEFVYTLNGSGLAIGRTVAAIMENYQNADGSITVPEPLRKYMGVDVIKK